MAHGFLRGVDGNKSNSRLVADCVILASLLFAQEVILLTKESMVATAVAAGTIFITMAGPAMAFLFVQKQNEIRQIKQEGCKDDVI
jgi:hypothetical protein